MVSENLKKYREKQGLTKEELSKKSGVSRRTIEFIEHEKVKNPGVYTLLKITKALKITINDLTK